METVKTMLRFKFYASIGNQESDVEIFALNEKDARRKLKLIFMDKREYRLHGVEETILYKGASIRREKK